MGHSLSSHSLFTICVKAHTLGEKQQEVSREILWISIGGRRENVIFFFFKPRSSPFCCSLKHGVVSQPQLAACHGTAARLRKVKAWEDRGSACRVTRRFFFARWSVRGGARDDRQRPAMTHGAYALLTATDTAMQKWERGRERGWGEGEDTITGARWHQ